MTPSDKLRELAELSEKATRGNWKVHGATHIWSPYGKANVASCSAPRTIQHVGYAPPEIGDLDETADNATFIAALVNWYRTEGRQLAEDGLRYRRLRADIARGDTQIGYLPKYLTHVASPDMMDAAIDAARSES